MPNPIDALGGKPRGFQEIKQTLQNHVREASFIVADKWKATAAALRNLGLKHAPFINHSKGFTDRATGFHSNDAESENDRIKRWNRARYGALTLSELEMHEYIFYVNGGKCMIDVMRGLAYSKGCV